MVNHALFSGILSHYSNILCFWLRCWRMLNILMKAKSVCVCVCVCVCVLGVRGIWYQQIHDIYSRAIPKGGTKSWTVILTNTLSARLLKNSTFHCQLLPLTQIQLLRLVDAPCWQTSANGMLTRRVRCMCYVSRRPEFEQSASSLCWSIYFIK